LTEEALASESKLFFIELQKSWNKEVRLQDRELSGFKNRLRDRYKSGFDLFRMLLTSARELGNEKLKKNSSLRKKEKKLLQGTISRLHTRGCQVAAEILVLLENGYADGAMARWRTLHEVTVVAMFIATTGTKTAERYIDHQTVDSYKAVEFYCKTHIDLGFKALSQKVQNKVRKNYEEALKKWGDDFKSEYGWASEALDKKSPRFTDIEEFVKKASMRSYYKMASWNVHTNPRSLFFRLGAIDSENIYLAGASNYGFTEPAQNASLSLLEITKLLIDDNPCIEDSIIVRTLNLIVAEIPKAFQQSEKEVEKAHRKQIKRK